MLQDNTATEAFYCIRHENLSQSLRDIALTRPVHLMLKSVSHIGHNLRTHQLSLHLWACLVHCRSHICRACGSVTHAYALLASIQASASSHISTAQSIPPQLIAQSESHIMGAFRCNEAMPCASEASPKYITAGSSNASTSRCCLPQVRQTPPGDLHQ